MLFNKNGQGYVLPNFLLSRGIVPDPLNIPAQIRGSGADPMFQGSVSMAAWNRVPSPSMAPSQFAANPAKNNRVLAPGSYFEIIGRK